MSANVANSKCKSRVIKHRTWVRWWLYVILILCLAIVMVGGATRLTGSGLSITEWKPIHGVLPPIGNAQWLEEFEKYQQIAQYQEVNQGMTLAGFKNIYWWEWSHRVLARIIGLITVVPFIYLLIKLGGAIALRPREARSLLQKWRKYPLLPYFIIAPILVGIQGVIGWWMVYSGLAQSQLTSVSQYRLATHLIAACIIIMFVTYLACGLIQYSDKPATRPIQKGAGWIVILVLLQIYFGALVAGLHAGLTYNTWPTMDGQFIPEGLFDLQPAWRNFFENALTVQFVHRMFAYLVLVVVAFYALSVEKRAHGTTHARRATILLIMVIVQVGFGIITLLMRVPIAWGLIHQFFALLVLVFVVAHWRATKGGYVSSLDPAN